MNEQIKLFAEQAGLGRERWNTTEQFHAFLEKFAELIVRECIDLFEVEWGEEKLTGNDVGYVVKKHFGVEE